MKQILILSGILIFAPAFLFSQNRIEEVLVEIEQNNTTLSALRKNADAEKIGNKTGLFPENPEVEFGYLWGNPSAIGTRTDVSISQAFDFPTAYKYRGDISEIKNEQVELEYEKQKKELLLHARTICNQLVYLNTVRAELQKRKTLADSILSAYQKKLDAGETSLLEYNKARLSSLSAGKELASAEIQSSALLTELAALNGGNQVELEISRFPLLNVPENFDEWFALAEQKNPLLSWLKKEVEVSQNREKLSKAMNMPKLSTGYMSEKTAAEHFQGITVGISIPLWENKNTVKHARAQTEAIQSIAADNQLQFYNRLKTAHQKFTELQQNVTDYKNEMRDLDNTQMLRKALNAGEISLIDYLMELSIYYDSVDKILEMEKELNDAFAELNQYM
jgi:outer membrane protein TolC